MKRNIKKRLSVFIIKQRKKKTKSNQNEQNFIVGEYKINVQDEFCKGAILNIIDKNSILLNGVALPIIGDTSITISKEGLPKITNLHYMMNGFDIIVRSDDFSNTKIEKINEKLLSVNETLIEISQDILVVVKNSKITQTIQDYNRISWSWLLKSIVLITISKFLQKYKQSFILRWGIFLILALIAIFAITKALK